MAHKIGPAKSPIETKTAFKGIVVGLAVMVLAIVVPFALSQLSGCGSGGSGGTVGQPTVPVEPSDPAVTGPTIEPGEGKIYFEVGNARRIRLDPDEWSPWLSLPPGASFRIMDSGQIQYWFWTRDNPEELIPDNDQVEWFGTVPSSIFRVRGESNLNTTIYVDW